MKLLKWFDPFIHIKEAICIWDLHERRKIAWRILEEERPGRRHTIEEWDTLAKEILAEWDKYREIRNR